MSKKSTGTMTVRLPDGRTMDVPKGLTGEHLASYVAAEERRRAEAQAAAEAAARHAAEKAEREKVEELSLQQQLDAANRRALAMEEELQQLKRATPEAAHMLMALQNASSQASRTLEALNRWDAKKSGEISLVAEELQKRNSVLDEEKEARLLESRRFMNSVAIAQGLPAPHPHLLEENDGGN